MIISNPDIARLLNQIAAALTIKKASIFQIRAYQTAADAIEHLTSDVKDLWEEGRLDEIPGVGENLKTYLDELLRTGNVKHFESLKKGINPAVFEFLDITGIGPKTALDLADLGVKNLDDLGSKIKNGELVKKGFSKKIAEKIYLSLKEHKNRGNRMLLPYASAKADKILQYLKKGPGVISADSLGSLRRQVATVGDLDFAAASNNPQKVVEYFIQMPDISRTLDQGTNKATVILNSGLQADLLVGDPESYGALLQHFTGSKHHNIKLRIYAQDKGYSLSEYGVRKLKKEELIETKTENEFYRLLGMDVPPPEIREDAGEIEAAINHKLPDLIELKDIRGDLHLHSNFPMIRPSHGPGVNPINEIIEKAIKLGYEYVGVSDHPPAFRTLKEEEMIKILTQRSKKIDQLKKNFKQIRVLNGLEVDILPDGTLSVPNSFLETLDYVIAGVHSIHRMPKEKMTERLLKTLENPNLDILSHPTGRLLNERDSSDVDWDKIFKYAGDHKKILEINGFPNRLDLRDDLVRVALKYGVKFVINTDAHEVSQMENMQFGVAVAKRGWATEKDVINSWDWKKFAQWFNIRK